MGKINMIGKTFDRLTVIAEAERSNDLRIKWLCRCECGKEKSIRGKDLRSGKIKSCGCLRSEMLSERKKKHGMTDTRFYRTWAGMIQRCSNPNKKSYKDYGGLGVEVIDRWKNFTNFMDDMYESYLEHSKIHGEKDTTIDRINVEGNYEPENCRWVTRAFQSRNKRVKSSNKSGVIGVHRNKYHNRWCASIGLNGVQIHLGIYADLDEAVKARKQAETDLNYYEPQTEKVLE